jgi:hypothetical protein
MQFGLVRFFPRYAISEQSVRENALAGSPIQATAVGLLDAAIVSNPRHC